MQALLLAGGLGKRLRSVVKDRPKPMALVNGKPFLEYVIKELKNNGIEDIIIAVGYKGSMIEDYFKTGSSFGVNIQYSYEEEQLGTAGAIKNAIDLIKEEAIFVLNADTFYKVNFSKLLQLNKDLSADMSMVLREVDDISRYGQARMENNRLIAFNEKVQEAVSGTINGGIYSIRKSVIEKIPQGKVSLENEIIPKLLAEKRTIGAVVETGYFIDIGIPADYFKFTSDVMEGIIK